GKELVWLAVGNILANRCRYDHRLLLSFTDRNFMLFIKSPAPRLVIFIVFNGSKWSLRNTGIDWFIRNDIFRFQFIGDTRCFLLPSQFPRGRCSYALYLCFPRSRLLSFLPTFV